MRKVQYTAGFLRDAAQDWFQNDRANITRQHEDGNSASFDIRFLAYFATPARKNRWACELQNLRQQEAETVEDYTRKFRKHLKKATTGNALPAQYQVNYFLNSLKLVLISQIVLSNPETLNAAIE